MARSDRDCRLDRRSFFKTAVAATTVGVFSGFSASQQSTVRAMDAVAANIDDTLFADQYAPQQVRAHLGWQETMAEDVTIAVLDNGVDYEHEDIRDRFGEDKGDNFVSESDDDPEVSSPRASHCTQVTGLCAGTTENGTGIAGISNANLIVGQIANRSAGESAGSGAIADAIVWGSEQADIVVIPSTLWQSSAIEDAIDTAVENGALPIAAAGNRRGDVGIPAQYENCLAVGAVDEDQIVGWFSNYGPEVDLVAPGVGVIAPTASSNADSEFDGKYGRNTGTSMACPIVAGAAALLKAANPQMGPRELRSRLEETAVDIGHSEQKQGAGRVDVANALEISGSNQDPPEAEITAKPQNPHVEETTVLLADPTADDGRIASYEWEIDGETADGPKEMWSFADPGTHDITLTVTDDDGQETTVERALNVREGGPVSEAVTETWSGTVSSADSEIRHTLSVESEVSSFEATLDFNDSDGSHIFAVYNGEMYRPFWQYGDGTLTAQDYYLDDETDFEVVVFTQGNTGEYELSITVDGFDEGGSEETVLDLGTETIDAGETATVPLEASGAPITGYETIITFDSENLAVADVSAVDTGWMEFDTADGRLGIAGVREEQDDELTLAEITFETAADASGAFELRFDAEESVVANEAGETPETVLDAGRISIESSGCDGTLGDVTGDGELNIGDPTVTQQYVTGEDVEINTQCADMNGDDSVDTADIIEMLEELTDL